MKRSFPRVAIVLLVAIGWGAWWPAVTYAQTAGSITELINAARQEGQLTVYAPSPLTRRGFDELIEAFNKKYGLSLRAQWAVSGSMTRDIAKVISEVKIGAPPSWDVQIMIEPMHFTGHAQGVLEPFDYARVLGTDPQLVQPGGAALVITEQVVLPAYNTKLVASKDVPKAWEDLLDPRWKGKIAVSTATHHWARLSQLWGDEKTTQFLTRLSQQNPMLGQSPETGQRVQSGEALIAATVQMEVFTQAQKTGAPVALAKDVQPVIIVDWAVSVPKRAKNANAARLFAGFMAGGEGRPLFEKRLGLSSIRDRGSLGYEYTYGKTLVRLSAEFALKMREREVKYGKILGFQ